MTIRLAAVAAITASIGVALPAAPAAAEQVGTDDIKLTTGADPRDAQVAYDPVNDRHLIVWDEGSGAPETIKGQIVNATGSVVAGPFTIGQPPVAGFIGEPAVTWDPNANRWWVAFSADDSVIGEREIYVNTVSAAGAPGVQFRVSDMGDDTFSFDAQQPDITFNATANEAFVVWRGDDTVPSDGEDEVWAQRLSSALTEVGTNDIRISTLGIDGNTLIDARGPQVAWHATSNQYAVVYEEQSSLIPVAVWVQPVGGDGVAGPAQQVAAPVAGVEIARATVAADDTGTGWLIAWEAFTIGTSSGAIAGRTFSSAGALGAPLSLSTAGVDSQAPDLGYNTTADRYGLVFHADALAGAGTEYEIYGTLLTPAGAVAEPLERLSTMGTDGVASTVTINGAVSQASGGRMLAVWQSDDTTAGDTEVYGQLFQVNVPPTVTINQAAGQADPTNASPISFTVVFSEQVVGFTNADISTAGSTATIGVITVSGPGPTYTVTVAASGNGTVVASIPPSVVNDIGGLPNSASTSTDNTVTIDTVAPTVTINQAAGQADPTNSGTVDFTAVFSEPVTGFLASDVSLAGSTATGGSVTILGAGPTYTIRVSGVTGSGSVVASIPASSATDPAGNGNAVSTSLDNTVAVDLTFPSVTIEQAAGQSDPTNTGPIAFTATFSEPVTGFVAADVVLSASGAPGPLSAVVTGTGPVYTVSVSGMTGDGTVIASIVASAATDAAGNASTASSSADNTVLYDAAVPTVTVTPISSDPTNADPVQFAVNFSELVTGFGDVAGDVSFTGSTAGGTLAATVTGGPQNYTVAVTGMTSSGEVSVSIPAAAATDAAANPNTASTISSVTWDNVAPSVTVDQAAGQVDPTNVSSILFTVVASEPLTGLVAADFSVSNGTPTAVAPTAVSGVYELSVTPSGPGAVTASLPGSSATDAAGNGNLASTSSDNSVTYDPTAPTVTIDQAAGQVDPTNVAPITFQVVFSEAVTGFGDGDVVLSASTATGTLAAAVSGSGAMYTVTVSGMTGSGDVIAAIAAGAAIDASGNTSAASTSSDNTVRFDIDNPTVGVGAAGGQASPTNASPINFIVVFSEPVTGFDASDISFTGSTTGGTLAAVIGAPTGNTYPVAVSGMAGSGQVQLSVPAGAATDAAGNLTTVSGNVIVTYDITDPVATITRGVGEANPNNGPSLTYSVTFTEAVTGVDSADFALVTTGTASGSIGTVASSAADTYTVTVTSIAGDGTLRLDLIGAGTGIVDAAGNGAGASTGEVFTIDAVAPTVTINQAVGQGDPVNSGPIEFTVLFSEPVTGFAAADVDLSTSTGVGSGLTASVSGSGASYTVSVSAMAGDGTVVARIVAAGTFDSAGNGNEASTSTDNSVDYDGVAPTVTVEQAAGQANDVNAGPIEFTVTFSEAVTGFVAADVVLGGTAGPTTVSVSGAGPVFTLSVTGMATNGTVTATVAAGAALDLVGNASLASTSVDNSVNFAPGDPNPGVNDAPTITAPATSNAELGVVVAFTGANAVSVADADAFGDPVQVTLTATDGTITAPATAGVTITGSGTASVTLVGPQSAVNSALAAGSVTFTEVGSKTLVIGADDLGHSPAPALTASKTITFTVVDTTPPVVTVPGASVLANSEPGKAGAVVTFTVIVTDRGSAPAANPGLTQAPAPTFTCSPSSGSFFPIGTTTVTCTAQDSVGNTSTASFSVIVSDTERPTITAPATQRAALPRGATTMAITYPVPTAADNSGQVTVTCVPASGSAFAAGTTTVTCTATDPSGNTASASFSVIVTAGTLPPTGGGNSFVPAALAMLLAGCLLVLTGYRRRLA